VTVWLPQSYSIQESPPTLCTPALNQNTVPDQQDHSVCIECSAGWRRPARARSEERLWYSRESTAVPERVRRLSPAPSLAPQRSEPASRMFAEKYREMRGGGCPRGPAPKSDRSTPERVSRCQRESANSPWLPHQHLSALSACKQDESRWALKRGGAAGGLPLLCLETPPR